MNKDNLQPQQFTVVHVWPDDVQGSFKVGDKFTFDGVYVDPHPRRSRLKQWFRVRYWRLRWTVGDWLAKLSDRVNGYD